MKIIKTLFTALAIIGFYTLSAQVTINTDGSAADGSAMLDLKSTDKGFLPPRMTEADRIAISNPVAGLVLWCTDCGPNGELQVYNGTAWTNMIGGEALNNLAIGAYHQGGVIFYLDGNGGGLVCAPYDQNEEPGIQWWNGEYTLTGATGILIGTGQANTIKIINGQGEGTYAATVCDNLTIDTYSDWFLPSRNELNEMYLNKTIIDSTSIAVGGTAFVITSTYYWSSSEYYNINAWRQAFYDGYQNYFNKDYTYRVRAVRAF